MISGSQKLNHTTGFTLVELIVVIVLISMMLFFAIPQVNSTFLTDNTKKVSNWIIFKIKALKENSVKDHKLYILHINMDTGKLWITDEFMTAEERRAAESKAFELPDNLKIMDVEYPDNDKIQGGAAEIRFYKKGYSDPALIHMENEDNKYLSFLIQPFLPRVRIYDKYTGFED